MEPGTERFLRESEIERKLVDSDSENNLESSCHGESESGGDSYEINDRDSKSDSYVDNTDTYI